MPGQTGEQGDAGVQGQQGERGRRGNPGPRVSTADLWVLVKSKSRRKYRGRKCHIFDRIVLWVMDSG